MITLSLQSLSRTARERPDGYLDDILSRARVDGDKVILSAESYAFLLTKYRQQHFSGPGTELSKLLKRFGIEPTPTCTCRAKAAEMDAWGCDECSRPERIEEVVAVMREEAAARGLPFSETVGRVLVRRAIANARRNKTPTPK